MLENAFVVSLTCERLDGNEQLATQMISQGGTKVMSEGEKCQAKAIAERGLMSDAAKDSGRLSSKR